MSPSAPNAVRPDRARGPRSATAVAVARRDRRRHRAAHLADAAGQGRRAGRRRHPQPPAPDDDPRAARRSPSSRRVIAYVTPPAQAAPLRAPRLDRDRHGRGASSCSRWSAGIFWPGGVDAALAEAPTPVEPDGRRIPASVPSSTPATIRRPATTAKTGTTARPASTTTSSDTSTPTTPTTKAGDRRRDPGGVHGGAAVPAGRVPVARARRARRGAVGARRRADRVGQDARRGVRDRPRARRGREGLLHDPAEGAVEPEVRRLRARRTAPTGSGCSPATTRSTATRRSS